MSNPVNLEDLIRSWIIDLRGRNLSPKTVGTYASAAKNLVSRLPPRCLQDASQITRADLSDYFARLAETRTPGGVSVDYRALQQFFKWADEVEEEITPNPMARMKPPIVPEPSTPVLRPEQIKALLKACEGKDFRSRRDLAIISLFLDCGLRREEIAGLELASVSTEHREVGVLGKGRRSRIVPFSHKCARALDRYERVRKAHKNAHLPGYWLGEKGGQMTSDGIDQAVRRRGKEAGIEGLHPHMLRHTWAHYQMKPGNNRLGDDEIMRLAGWKSRQMLGRYAASTLDERAREAGKSRALLDWL